MSAPISTPYRNPDRGDGIGGSLAACMGVSGNDHAPLSIVLPWPPSNNHYYTVARGRKILGAKGRQYREVIAEQAKRELWPMFSKVYGIAVDIEAWMPDRRKRDLDNVLKATLDALTHASLWMDDSQVCDLRIHRAPKLGGMLKITVREIL